MDTEEYNKIPDKCKLCLRLLCRINTSDNEKELIEKYRIQRMQCWNTNHCGWDECILEIPRNDFKKLKCHCGGNLKINDRFMVCMNCNDTFEVISFDKEWIYEDKIQDDIDSGKGDETEDVLVLPEDNQTEGSGTPPHEVCL